MRKSLSRSDRLFCDCLSLILVVILLISVLIVLVILIVLVVLVVLVSILIVHGNTSIISFTVNPPS